MYLALIKVITLHEIFIKGSNIKKIENNKANKTDIAGLLVLIFITQAQKIQAKIIEVIPRENMIIVHISKNAISPKLA